MLSIPSIFSHSKKHGMLHHLQRCKEQLLPAVELLLTILPLRRAATVFNLNVTVDVTVTVSAVTVLYGTCKQVKQINNPPSHATGDTAHADSTAVCTPPLWHSAAL
jgi:hypothetical protein